MWQTILSRFANIDAPCSFGNSSFFGFPRWYEYMQGREDALGKCMPYIDPAKGFAGLLPIGVAVLDILLRLAGLIAVAFIVYAGFQYITSQGEPEQTTKAKDGLINAVVGLVIVVISTAVVSYIGGRLTK